MHPTFILNFSSIPRSETLIAHSYAKLAASRTVFCMLRYTIVIIFVQKTNKKKNPTLSYNPRPMTDQSSGVPRQSEPVHSQSHSQSASSPRSSLIRLPSSLLAVCMVSPTLLFVVSVGFIPPVKK